MKSDVGEESRFQRAQWRSFRGWKRQQDGERSGDIQSLVGMRFRERLGSLGLLVGTDINRDKGDNKTSPRGVKNYNGWEVVSVRSREEYLGSLTQRLENGH